MTEDDELSSYKHEINSRALAKAEDQPFIGPIVGTPSRSLISNLAQAGEHVDAGTNLPGRTRFSFLKRWVMRLIRPVTTRQVAYNREVLTALHTINSSLETLEVQRDQRLTSSDAALTNMELTIHDIFGTAETLEQTVDALQNLVFGLSQQRKYDRTELLTQRSKLNILLNDLRSAVPQQLDVRELQNLDSNSNFDDLYSQLEDRFRGSSDEVKERLRPYIDDVKHLAGQDAPVVDVGCGRGEWLELLRDHGIPAYGVDTNESFVRRNEESGFDIRFEDAINHLARVPESSIGAVTGFHLAEHLPFDSLVALIDNALVALKPGGLLIFETPNPTNLIVGAAAFYIDPTHQRPLHPQFLDFLVGARGFLEADIRYLHPSPEAPFPLNDTIGETESANHMLDFLNWALFGPQDYAIVAKKASATE